MTTIVTAEHLPKCNQLEAEGPWLEPRVQKLQLVVTELERGEHDNLNQKPLESHGCSSIVVFPGKTVQVYEEMYSLKSDVYGLPDGIINTSANMTAPLQKVVRGASIAILKTRTVASQAVNTA